MIDRHNSVVSLFVVPMDENLIQVFNVQHASGANFQCQKYM